MKCGDIWWRKKRSPRARDVHWATIIGGDDEHVVIRRFVDEPPIVLTYKYFIRAYTPMYAPRYRRAGWCDEA